MKKLLFFSLLIFVSCASEREKQIKALEQQSVKELATLFASAYDWEIKINTDSIRTVWQKIHLDSAELGLAYVQDIASKLNQQNLDAIAKIEAEREAAEKVKRAKKKEAERKLKTFRKKSDEFRGLTFYRDKRTPGYTSVNFIYPYIGKNESGYFLRFKIQYTSSDWLFIENAIFLMDGERHVIYGDWERDNNSKIWEWTDVYVDKETLQFLDKLSKAKSAKVRYSGSQYYKDRTVTYTEKMIIKKTLEIYKAL